MEFLSWEVSILRAGSCVIFLNFINFMYEQPLCFVDFAQADENMRVIVLHESPKFVSHKMCELPVRVPSFPIEGLG